jgi:hypothetical protein
MEPHLLQDDRSPKLMCHIFGAIAEYEKTMIVLKLLAPGSVHVMAGVKARSGSARCPVRLKCWNGLRLCRRPANRATPLRIG